MVGINSFGTANFAWLPNKSSIGNSRLHGVMRQEHFFGHIPSPAGGHLSLREIAFHCPRIYAGLEGSLALSRAELAVPALKF